MINVVLKGNNYKVIEVDYQFPDSTEYTSFRFAIPKINNDNKAVVILSGGLDSTILTNLLHWSIKNPSDNLYALSFCYNQRHKVELEKASKTCELLNIKHKIIPIEFLSDIIENVSALSGNKKVDVPTMDEVKDNSQPITYVPFRNMLFLTLAASFAESNDCKYILIGAQAGDLYGYWDCTSDFMDSFNNVLKLNRKHKIELVAPFVNLSKAQEIIIGTNLNVDFSNTHTCYNGIDELGRSCGKCPTCTERLNNFAKVGIKDPIKYIE